MIQVNSIDGTPEYIPSQYKLVHFDGVYFNFLETDQEVADYNATIIVEDPRRSADYYEVRAAAGRKFVNEVTTNLLTDYYEGRRTFAEIMAIEELLEKVIDKLNDGNFLTAKYRLISVVGLDTTLYTEIMTGIDSRIAIHYPPAQ